MVNPETDADGGQIVSKPGEYDLAIDSAGQITFTVQTTSGTHSLTSPVIAGVDQWSSVKARYTPNEIALTVNGQTTTQSITGNITAGVSHVVMGSSFTGNLDEITFSYGNQLTGGLPLNIQGLDINGQIQLDGSGNATLTVASNGSMGSSDSPELGTVRVSINPTTDAEKGVITAPATQIAIMEAAAGQVKINTSGTDRDLTDAEREECVA
ncbi:MAG: LamG domain-containing protein, partial [Bdellovibrionaceae bacterium]|nr:LamG domain-containing protein [Pseudobdellovibrionaceae bacterium]